MTYLGFVTLVGNCQKWVGFCQIWVRSGFVKYGRQDLSHMGVTRVGIVLWYLSNMGWVLSNMGWVGVCQIWGQDLSQMGGTEGRNWFKRRARLRSPTV